MSARFFTMFPSPAARKQRWTSRRSGGLVPQKVITEINTGRKTKGNFVRIYPDSGEAPSGLSRSCRAAPFAVYPHRRGRSF
jgi:hypothetical protein